MQIWIQRHAQTHLIILNIWFPRLRKKAPSFFARSIRIYLQILSVFLKTSTIYSIHNILYCISSEIYYHRRLKKHVEVKKAMGFRTLSYHFFFEHYSEVKA